MYIRENNQENILAYMDYINELFFSILEYLYHISRLTTGKNEKGYS